MTPVKISSYSSFPCRFFRNEVGGSRFFFTKLFGPKSKTPSPPTAVREPGLNIKSYVQAQGMKMPVLGLGTWQSSAAQVGCAVQDAIEAGYRHIDTSPTYGNQRAIGCGLCRAFDRGLCCREDLFITTKLPDYGMNAEHVPHYLYKSLQDLRLKYVDLYLINFPAGSFFDPATNHQAPDFSTCHARIWQAMEDQVYAGHACAIGLCNFNRRQVDNILGTARIPPANLQLEMNVYCQQKEMLEYCKNRNITLSAYAPLGSPAFATAIVNPPGKPPPRIGRRKKLQPMIDPTVAQVARKHAVGPALVLLRYLLHLGVAVLPKSADYGRVRLNAKVFDFELDNCDMMALRSLDRGDKGGIFQSNVWKGLEAHPEYPFNRRR